MKNILMNAEMAKAILDGRKTQTRRAIKQEIVKPTDSKFPKNEMYLDSYKNTENWYWWTQDGRQNLSQCIKAQYKKGDVVWVREPARIHLCFAEEIHFHYLADYKTSKLNIPKRFIKDGFVVDWMAHCNGVPNGCIKEMARILLKITDVRVERLQDISGVSIEDEGAIHQTTNEVLILEQKLRLENIDWYKSLWNKTAPKGYKWEDNPYVFVYEFERVKYEQ